MKEKNPEAKPISLAVFNGVGYKTITISPNDEHQYWGQLSDRKFKTRNHIHAVLMEVRERTGMEYSGYLEWSEPRDNTLGNRGPRCHYHGIIRLPTVKSVDKWLEQGFPLIARTCILEVDNVTHPHVWIAYIKKQQNVCIIDRPIESHESLIDNMLKGAELKYTNGVLETQISCVQEQEEI